MTATQTLKHYGETAVKLYKTQLLATVGAGDLAVERARTVAHQLRTRAVALPGEAQVQVDLAAKEARNRAEDAAGRARGAVQSARTSAEHLASAVRPESVKATVTELVGAARTQATATIESLAERGAEVIEDLRRQPAFRRVAFRAGRTVDTVEGVVEGALEGTAEAVAEASNEVTSVAQKTAAKAGKALDSAEEAAHVAAESAKGSLEATAEAGTEASQPAGRPAKKSSAARVSTPARTTARVTRARTAERTDPTAVPAKKND